MGLLLTLEPFVKSSLATSVCLFTTASRSKTYPPDHVCE